MHFTPGRTTIEGALERLGHPSVAVVGRPVLDAYLYGTTLRVSREAPVLVVREDGREIRLGGAANTAANLSALGVQTHLVGLVGQDEGASQLVNALAAGHLGSDGLIQSATTQTAIKTRVLAGGLHTTKQQMLRLDREPRDPMIPADREALLERATDILSMVDAIVISDYGDARDTALYTEIAMRARSRQVLTVVDSRYALMAFKEVTAVTPNEPEAQDALGMQLGSDEAALIAARTLVHQLDLDAALITRGREGLAVAEREGAATLIAAHGGHEAVDVTGAGDTVAAVFTLALAAGLEVVEGAALANCAASLVVRRLGTSVATRAELSELARSELT